LVLIVAVLLTLPEVDVSDTGLLEKVQVAPAGTPPQDSATLPVNPSSGAIVMVMLAESPWSTHCEVGRAEMEKSVTFCVTPAEVLELKLLSPTYLAFRVLLPAAGKLMEHCPVATAAVQVSPALSLTVTLPVGVPLPGATGFTVKLHHAVCPTTEGSGHQAVMVVLVPALFTVCETPEEVALVA